MMSATVLKLSAILLLAVGSVGVGAGWLAQNGPGAIQSAEAQPAAPKAPQAAEVPAKFADAELHVIGVYSSKDRLKEGGTVEVEVRSTAKPVILVLTSYFSVNWHVKLAKGAKIKKALLSGYFAQEIQGLPADVPVENRSYFPQDGSRRTNGWFYAYEWNTPEWREVVRRLNEMTGLPVATFQSKNEGDAFVVDGKLGRDRGQEQLKPPPPAPRDLTPQQLLAASRNAELHIVGIYSPDMNDPGKPVNVEVRAAAKPSILVLTSYYSVIWNIRCETGAKINAVIVGSPRPQVVEGLSADVPVQRFFPDGSTYFFDRAASARDRQSFYADQYNTLEYRRMVERLNEITGLLVSTFQGANTGRSFVVDGSRGRNFAQSERKPRPTFPKEPTPQEFLAAAAGADLHVVSIYWANTAQNGIPVDVEVRPTGKPIVLALASYYSVLWKVKLAPGAQVKAVIIAGYYEQEFEGVPTNIPVVGRFYFPDLKQGFFYAYKSDTPEYPQMVKKLNDLTGLFIATCQLAYAGTSFIVDGARGRGLVQKERIADGAAGRQLAQKTPKADEDPLADVADIPSRELQAGGDAHKRYFLIGPKKNTQAPASGYGLVVILPGGDGSADFHPFVKRIYKNALSDGYLAAQPVAVKWTPNQEIVWPTKSNSVAKMDFTTEDFIDSVIEDVAKKHKVDREKVFTLSWSSSGPAAYAASLRDKRSIAGSFIAMSVFNPRFLPPLQKAKDHAYYLYHSPDDRICPYRMAEQANKQLPENGAKVRLETYDGGHGWRGNVYGDIRQGMEWLEKNAKGAGGP